MFRNQYDGDITTWSPKGRIHQVEYALEAVKHGSACVGVKSGRVAVLAALKRSASTLAEPQRKVFAIASHMGIAVSGLCADARSLVRLMRAQCLDHAFVFDAAQPSERLVEFVANKSQVHTQKYGRRPYGVGLLVAAYDDDTGAHLFETQPDGNYFEYKAYAIGARSQSAKTYLEKHVADFAAASRDQLINHALLALRDTVASKDELGLTTRNTTIAFVGDGMPFTVWEGEQLKALLDNLEGGTGGKKPGDDDDDDAAVAAAAAAAPAAPPKDSTPGELA
jgi:20S proteasome subunit alpha 6